jgi:hypothetical protein
MTTDTLKLTLRDIVVPGPVERGLYFVDRSPDVAGALLDRIVDLLWWDSVATPGLPSSRLAIRMSRPSLSVSAHHHRRSSRIGALHWIDTGRLFDVGGLLSQARLRGLDGGRVARSLRVQYPVGARPYLEALERIPNAALCALGGNERPQGPTLFSRMPSAIGEANPPSSIWWTPLVVISDLFSPVEESQMAFGDRDEVHHRLIERLEHLRERAVVIAFTGNSSGDRFFDQQVLRLGTPIACERGHRGAEPVMSRPAFVSTLH